MGDNVAEIEGLSRRFGRTLALDNVNLNVERGYVYGLVGANGHGKTTLIKHLLGLLRAKSGKIRVFGRDPVRHPVHVLQRIGYLSEERDLPEWMRVDELLRYTAAYYPGWDQRYAEELLETFKLDRSKKIKELSKGMRAQVGLIAAVAPGPELLLLDEPSTGLDAVVRKDILNAIIRAVADDGRTVIFSSHLLDEVEQMSDRVLMIDRGRLVLQGDLDDVKQQHQLLSVEFYTQREQLPRLDGLLTAERMGNSWRIVRNGSAADVREQLESLGGRIVQSRQASLQEIFLARVGRDFEAKEAP